MFTAGIEQPDATIDTIFGKNDIDSNSVPSIAPCSATGNTVGVSTAVTAANGTVGTVDTPVTTACASSFAFFDTLQATMPEYAATARVNQPWGHLQLGGVLRDQVMNDGQYFNSNILGYVGTISGDAHPFSGNPGPLGKDDLGFMFAGGQNTGNQIGNGAGTVTNFGAPINVPGVGLVNPLAQTAGTAAGSTAAWNARSTNQGALTGFPNSGAFINGEIGRASCRERV